jgi:ribosome recycling factor
MANKPEPGKDDKLTLRDVEAQDRSRMEKAIDDLRHELAGVRTGRASVSLLDSVKVDYYGTPTPVNQVATLSVPDPSMIQLQPWDVSQIGSIEKAIRASDLGLNPMNDGKLVRIPIPALTEERRKEMVKHLHHVLEHHRVAVRNIRRDANHTLKEALKKKEIAEDEERRTQDEIQKLTDRFVTEIDKALAAKETDLMAV